MSKTLYASLRTIAFTGATDDCTKVFVSETKHLKHFRSGKSKRLPVKKKEAA